jgi:hypothetical protein
MYYLHHIIFCLITSHGRNCSKLLHQHGHAWTFGRLSLPALFGQVPQTVVKSNSSALLLGRTRGTLTAQDPESNGIVLEVSKGSFAHDNLDVRIIHYA